MHLGVLGVELHMDSGYCGYPRISTGYVDVDVDVGGLDVVKSHGLDMHTEPIPNIKAQPHYALCRVSAIVRICRGTGFWMRGKC
jgi:hypothetical protein